MKQGVRNFFLLGSLATCWLAVPLAGSAQIIPDTTLPVNSLVTQNGTESVITGGTAAGANLFHSFREFSLLTGNTAYFNNAAEIQNIITRVTGGNLSNIDGILKANGSANLFLINPNGIIFGPNAALNIGGSFLASTASSIKFADGSSFDATNPSAPPLLTVSVPIGLQFGANPGRIVVQGTGNNLSIDLNTLATITDNRPVGLQVAEGQTLALVGGEVSLEGGNITAPSGRIELGSAGDFSSVSLNSPDSGSGWSLGYADVENFSTISLSNAASVDVSGSGGGNIQVRTRNLRLSDGSTILALTEGSNSGGKIEVNAAESVELIGTTASGQYLSSLVADVQPGATGNGGDLIIETRRLIVRDGAQIGSNTFSSGRGGTLTVRATDSVEALGTSAGGEYPSGLLADAEKGSTGDGGNLTIETGRLIVRDGAQISSNTFSSGRGGTLTVRATDSVEAIGSSADGESSSGLFADAEEGSTGNGGDLSIETGRLIVRDGAAISSRTLSSGKGGTLTVRATDSVEAIGSRGGGRIPSGLFADAQAGTGDGGDLSIETGRLIVRDGALIGARTFSSGRGGTLTVRARDSVEAIGTGPGSQFLTGLFVSANPGSTGDGGNLTIETGRLIVGNRAEISVSSQGTGAAGNMVVNAGVVRLDSSSSLTATTQAGGGNITVNSPDIQLRRRSSINTNARGTSAGGNITLDTKTLAALENSDITANSQESFGGRVIVNARGIFGTKFRKQLTRFSDITASSELGEEFSGTVEINTPGVDPAAGLVTLPSNLVDVSRLIASNCEALAKGSSFTVTGSGGLPPNPAEPLVSSAVVVDWARREASEPESRGEIPSSGNPRSQVPTPIVEATGWAVSPKGEVILTANAASLTPNSLWYQSPSCPNLP